jgi:hypothetical protein
LSPSKVYAILVRIEKIPEKIPVNPGWGKNPEINKSALLKDHMDIVKKASLILE